MAKKLLDLDLDELQSDTGDEGIKIDKMSTKDIAVIGVAARMPFADSKDEYWETLRKGVDCVRKMPDNRRKDIERYLRFYMGIKGRIHFKEVAYLDEVDKFDYNFFNFVPKEAELTDPHQRLFLETVWETIEDAGYGGEKLTGSRTGVYVGQVESEYKTYVQTVEPESLPMAMSGNTSQIIASRISYFLDLRGPTMLINTTCSSSLVAIHLACQGIRNGDCEMALAGAVKVQFAPLMGGADAGIESSDGRARTFDDSCEGTGMGEGTAAVLLKPLSKALMDGDHIYAVIKGSSINQDGRSIGITAPNPAAQEDVIFRAWKDAGINPETIGYIETHGTGTKLGDPIEIEGLQRAFRRFTSKRQFCAVGAVKSSMGHLDAAAGIAGFTKGVLALKNREIPPTLHFKRPNRKINFEDSPVYVNDRLREWEVEDGALRRCGVSAFGIGGTNCHIVLEEAPVVLDNRPVSKKDFYILTLSAKSENVLVELVKKYRTFIDKNENLSISDICFTANTGRSHLNCRLALLVKDWEDLKEKLDQVCINGLNGSNNSDVFYQMHKLILSVREDREAGEITEREKSELDAVTAAKMKELAYSRKDDLALAKEICMDYVKGAEVKWDELYYREQPKRVSLPTYPFEKNRCWIEIPYDELLYSDDNLYYHSEWVERESAFKPEESVNGGVLILWNGQEEDRALMEGMALKFTETGRKVIDIILGPEFQKAGETSYILAADEEGFIKLFENINLMEISQIVHLGTSKSIDTISGLDPLNEVQEKGVLSILQWVQALVKMENTYERMEMVFVSDYVNEVTGNERVIKPENSLVFGLGKVIGLENILIKCRCIDIDDVSEASDIAQEINTPYSQYMTAFRDGKRYVEELAKLDISKFENREVKIKEKGVYVITGGTGVLGIEMSKYIASKGKANLALISRTPMPDRNTWDAIVAEGKNLKLCNAIQWIREIENQGSRIITVSADVSNENEMRMVLDNLRNQFSGINGIIHCAGVGVGQAGIPIRLSTKEDFTSMLSPKVQGTWVLDKLTEKDPMDFFILFSSAITIVGGYGAGSYCAANSYLDSFASYRKKRGEKTLAINWPTWDYLWDVNSGSEFDNKQMFSSISGYEALDALDGVVGRDIERLAIGRVNFYSDIFYLENQLPFRLSKPIKDDIETARKNLEAIKNAKGGARLKDVSIKGRKNGDYTDTETLIAKIWADVLGLSEINILDGIYELGGDSIIAMKIVNSVNKNLEINLDVAELLRFQTIKDFSKRVDEQYLGRESIYSSIKPVEEREYYPLSSAQKRVFIVEQYQGIGTSYNMPIYLWAEGDLDKDKIEKAIEKLIGRHEALRTSFGFVDGEPVQKVHKYVDFAVDYHEVSEDTAKEMIENFVQPFDLSRAPLLRLRLLKMGESKFILMFDMHHIISDGTSHGLIVKEFIDFYKGQELPPLKLHYKDFTMWQNDLFESEHIRKQEQYWLDKYSDGVPVLNLPLDFPRPPVQSFDGNAISFILSEEVSASLNNLVVETGTSLYMILMSLYAIMLSKFSGQDDIVIGSGIAGRPHADLENILGMFVNSLTLRCTPKADYTYLDYLESVKETALEAYENQDYQFEKLVEILNIPRDLSRNPMFDAVMVLQNMEAPNLEIEGVTFTPFSNDYTISKFDISLYATEIEKSILITIEYCKALFKAETIEEMANSFRKITDIVLANRSILLKDIEIMDSSEKESIVNKIQKGKDFFKKFEEDDFGDL